MAQAFIGVVEAEVARARQGGAKIRTDDRPGGIDLLTIADRLTVIMGWLNAGCPDRRGSEEDEAVGEQAETNKDPEFSHSVVFSPTGQTPPLRSGEWAKGLEYLAIHGLQEPDSVGMVLYEMATYLHSIELFDLPPGERKGWIVALLSTFVRTKHNGMVDRSPRGKERELIRQVENAVRAVARNRYPRCLEHFALIRQRRERGQYRNVINLAPRIEGA